MAKLFTSEAAGRCADRWLQAFGGRRATFATNVAERFLRGDHASDPHLGRHVWRSSA